MKRRVIYKRELYPVNRHKSQMTVVFFVLVARIHLSVQTCLDYARGKWQLLGAVVEYGMSEM